MKPLNPSGLCMCGCGEPAPLAQQTHTERGYQRGKPVKYIAGHHRRKSPVEYVEKDMGYDTPCWIWQRSICNGGYGRANRRSAHRMYYERFVGPIPEGMEIDHLCRNRACVNPAHLEPVTHAENDRRGVNARLTADDVRTIRRLVECGRSQVSVAKEYGVTSQHVGQIIAGKKWRLQ